MSIEIQCISKYKWRTGEDFELGTPITGHFVEGAFYRLERDGSLFIRSGYAWNGTSGGVRDSEENLGASLVHDVFYQMLREHQLPMKRRAAIDRLFGTHCRALGTSRGRARLYVWALRVFAKRAATRNQFQIAPTMTIPTP